MDKAKKNQIVSDLTEKFEKAKSLTFSEYKGLTVAEANALRAECRNAGLEYMVAKNTLIHLALPESVRADAKPFLEQTTSIALDYKDGVDGPKTLASFAKEHKAIVLKAGVLDGDFLDTAGVVALSKLPSKDELLAKILGSVNAPATNVLGCINGVGTKLAGLLNAYKDKLGEQAA